MSVVSVGTLGGRTLRFCWAALVVSFASLLPQNRLLAQGDGSEYAGAFLEIPVGAKALGLGGAFTALADDGTAFFWNPAGVSLLDSKTLSGMYSSQYGAIGSPGGNYYFAGWSMPVSSLGFSINWIRFAISDIPVYGDLTDPVRFADANARHKEVIVAQGGETFNDAEDAFVFSFSRNNKFDLDLGWSYFSIPIEIPAGINIKLIRQNIFEKTASGIGIDAGLMLRVNLKDFFFSDDWPLIAAGVSLKDIGGTSLKWEQSQRKQDIRQVVTTGFALIQPLRPFDSKLTWTVDFAGRFGGEASIGLEWKYRRQFSFRVGINSQTLSAGAGVDFNFFDVDYAYLASSEHQLGQVHRLGLAFNFDRLLEKNSR